MFIDIGEVVIALFFRFLQAAQALFRVAQLGVKFRQHVVVTRPLVGGAYLRRHSADILLVKNGRIELQRSTSLCIVSMPPIAIAMLRHQATIMSTQGAYSASSAMARRSCVTRRIEERSDFLGRSF